MKTVTKDMLIPTKHVAGESHLFGFFQEASTLGFAPGEWPMKIVLSDRDYGNPVLTRLTFIEAGKADSGYTYCDVSRVFKIDITNSRITLRT